ncbi:helix-turn-helix domain-containing protein [Rhodobacteraceae bacterium NNCM2]|nr:helix-turn-helix domain-containing protein [Coraliihabitans acroporae]
MKTADPHAGSLLREWRERRRFSQLALASEVRISQRHLSFLESGRSRPSPGMVLRLCEALDVPLRECNAILSAAGYAPHYPQRAFDTAEMAAVKQMIEQIVQGHLPHPALAVDRHWKLLAANGSARHLMAGVAPHLLEAEVDMLTLSLHPEGLALRILNLAEWRAHLLARLRHDIAYSADPVLSALYADLSALPAPDLAPHPEAELAAGRQIAVPLRLSSEVGELEFLSTTTVFGTAVDVILSEVTIEAFFPANEATARAIARL